MAEAGTGGARLLVVDDNKVNRLLLVRSVELLGHSAATAENGRIALDVLHRERFDLVLLDLAMPEMDGFAVLERLRADAELHDVPVIVTSSNEGIEDVVRSIELGAEDYLHKPVNPVLLRARIGATLEKKRLRDREKALLGRLATREVAQDVSRSGFALGGKRVQATILFCDIRSFTALAETMSPEDTIDFLNAWYTLMFDAIGAHHGMVNAMAGDGLMAIFGAPTPRADHAAQAVAAAVEMVETIALFNAERAAGGLAPIRIGVGIASGEVVAGFAGTNERATYTCIGDVVNLASRLEAHTKEAGKPILVDAATAAAAGDAAALARLGPVQLRGRAAAVEVYAVETVR